MGGKNMKHHIEIKGVYDGTCVVYDKETDTFHWNDIALERLSQEEIKGFENSFRIQFSNQKPPTV